MKMLLLFTVISFAGFCALQTHELLWSFLSALYYSIFYVIGYLVRIKDVKLESRTAKPVLIICCILSMLLLAKPSWYNACLGPVPVYVDFIRSIFFALLGIAACIQLSITMQGVQLIRTIGKHSLAIFCLHIFVLEGFYYLLTSFGLTVNQGYNIYAVTETILCIFILKPVAIMLDDLLSARKKAESKS